MKQKSSVTIGSLTHSLTGIIKIPPQWDYKEEISNILLEKYGLSDEEIKKHRQRFYASQWSQ